MQYTVIDCTALQYSYAASITVVVPNYPFARADKVDKPRTPIMAK